MKGMAAMALLLCAMVGAIAGQAESAAPPAQITLTSDFNTWVSVTNTRVPQKFNSVTFALSPGDYEVVGRRKGYRDVTKSLQIRSGMAPVIMTIVCTVRADE